MLRKRHWGEADLLVTLLHRRHGKVTVLARALAPGTGSCMRLPGASAVARKL